MDDDGSVYTHTVPFFVARCPLGRFGVRHDSGTFNLRRNRLFARFFVVSPREKTGLTRLVICGKIGLQKNDLGATGVAPRFPTEGDIGYADQPCGTHNEAVLKI